MVEGFEVEHGDLWVPTEDSDAHTWFGLWAGGAGEESFAFFLRESKFSAGFKSEASKIEPAGPMYVYLSKVVQFDHLLDLNWNRIPENKHRPALIPRWNCYRLPTTHEHRTALFS